MSFEEIVSLDADVTIAIGKTNKATGKPYPKQAEGYYLGKRSVESKRGASTLHFLLTSDGNLGVWGTTDLDRKLGQVTPGAMVEIVSTGTKATPNGDMYTYRVRQDKTNTIEVGNIAAAPAATDDDTEDYDASTEANGADPDAEDTAQAMALAAAERKAKVEALLKNTKRKTN